MTELDSNIKNGQFGVGIKCTCSHERVPVLFEQYSVIAGNI